MTALIYSVGCLMAAVSVNPAAGMVGGTCPILVGVAQACLFVAFLIGIIVVVILYRMPVRHMRCCVVLGGIFASAAVALIITITFLGAKGCASL
jgi:hypothetical protein